MRITRYIQLPIVLFILAFLFTKTSEAQVPHPALIGYLHNWNYSKSPYIEPEFVDNRYNIIIIAFATPKTGTTYDIHFSPVEISKNEFIRQIQSLQQQGRKVIISIGGGGIVCKINTYKEKEELIASVTDILETYGFDGIDLDLESQSVMISGGTIEHPIDSTVIYMIDAVKEIMANYRKIFEKKLILTMAPETAYVQGGQSRYGGVWGAHLPIIDALRDSLTIVHTQLYNSGSMYGIDRNIYIQGTADFIVAMSEALIQGFDTKGGHFAGLPARKVAIGLPACPKAAGSGYTLPVHVRNALKYLTGRGPQPGLYVLQQESGYPEFAGMMTWSINWDAVSTCGSAYEYADIFDDVFSISSVRETNVAGNIYPNPATSYIEISTRGLQPSADVNVYDVLGRRVLNTHSSYHNVTFNPVPRVELMRLDVTALPAGVYFVRMGKQMLKFVKM